MNFMPGKVRSCSFEALYVPSCHASTQHSQSITREVAVYLPEWHLSPGGGHGIPPQYSCLEDCHGQRSLTGYSLWGHKESDTTDHVTFIALGMAWLQLKHLFPFVSLQYCLNSLLLLFFFCFVFFNNDLPSPCQDRSNSLCVYPLPTSRAGHLEGKEC